MRGVVMESQPLQSSPGFNAGRVDSAGRLKNGARALSVILVVEDEILIRMAAANHLRDCGYRVLEAADGEEARILLRADEPIEIVFSDINMPGMDGLMLAAWIAKELPDVKVVLTSGDIRNAVAARATAFYLEKPYDLYSLEQLIKRLI